MNSGLRGFKSHRSYIIIIINERLIELCDALGLTQVVQQPTRENNILDLFLVTSPDKCTEADVLNGISDHDAVCMSYNRRVNRNKKTSRKVYLFKRADMESLKGEITHYIHAYVRSKQNVRDKVGPLKDTAGNIITQGFLMAEELNMHFSSVFTRENTSSLPVPETKFNGSEGEKLGQLVVTPEVVASKINNMKENKSPGVDGISPKILKEIVEQISMPLAHVFNMSLQEGIVPLEWKEANIIPLFKKGSRNKSVNYRPVSLTSVICKLLETIIRDHMMDFLLKHRLTYQACLT